MTIEITSPAQPILQRASHDALMRAFSVAKQLGASLAVLPNDFKLTDNFQGAYTVELYFHQRPDLVQQFAAQVGVETASRPFGKNGDKTYTSADATVDEVPVHAWALVDNEAAAVAA